MPGGYASTEYKLSALPQVSGSLSHVMTGQDVTLTVTVIVIVALALVTAVVLTAVSSPDRAQRRDARKVFDRIIRGRW